MKSTIISITIVSIIIIIFISLSIYVYSSHTITNSNQYSGTNSNPKNKANGILTTFYGCTSFGTTQSIHCDPLLNRIVGYTVTGASSLIYTSHGDPAYLGDNKGRTGVFLDAKRMEAIEIPDNSSKFDSNKISISFWVKNPEKDAQPYGVIISHTTREGDAGWSIDSHTSGPASSGSQIIQNVSFSVFNKTGQQFTSPIASVSSSNGGFTHIAATFDGSSVKIYKNGNLAGSTQFKGQYVSNPGLPISIGSSSFCLTCNRWSGIISDVRIYNRSIDQNEVRQIFSNDSINNISNGLDGYWTFDHSLEDISGNNNNGIVNSMITTIAFTPDGRLFFTEKNTGKIKIMEHDRVLTTPFATLSDVYVSWEQGLLGLTIDPEFKQNHFIYLYYTALDNKNGQIFNRIVRFTDNNNQGVDKVVLVDRIPASVGYHSGGALAFGPDNRLYVGVGDATEHEFAQDPGILTGKVLRINRDGTIPDDNPFRNSPVYTIGHRNIYGIAFDNHSKTGIVAEDGDFHYDKINLLQKGGNYGFPTLLPPNLAPELFTNNSAIKPLISYWQTITPTQTIYYTGDRIPELNNKFLVGAYRGQIYALTVNAKDKQIVQQERIALRHYPFEPVISIAQSPSGDIYYAGYHIYKLDSIDSDKKKQDLFPLEIRSKSAVDIKDVQVSSTGGRNILDISVSANNPHMLNSSGSIGKPNPLFVNVYIPRAIIGSVSSVRDSIMSTNGQVPEGVTAPVKFITDDNSSSTNSLLNIPLRADKPSAQLLSVLGVAASNYTSGAQNNPAALTRNIQYGLPIVSIVKYAADPSTPEPYSPSSLNVPIGTTVKWINNDSVSHTVTEGTFSASSTTSKSKFDSGIFGPGQTFQYKFNRDGVVNYYCSIHPFMIGKILVK